MTPEQAQDVKLELLGCMDSADVSEHLKDAAATIAGMTEEWGVQVKERTGWVPVGIYSPDLLWASARESAEYVASGIHKSLETRLVRRLVGPVQVVE